MANTQTLLTLIRKFTNDRHWVKYHQPKDLVLKLIEEVGELGQHFQWKTDQEIKDYLQIKINRSAVEDEAMDVLIVLLMVVDYLNCDIEKAFLRKMQKNALKYPVKGKQVTKKVKVNV